MRDDLPRPSARRLAGGGFARMILSHAAGVHPERPRAVNFGIVPKLLSDVAIENVRLAREYIELNQALSEVCVNRSPSGSTLLF